MMISLGPAATDGREGPIASRLGVVVKNSFFSSLSLRPEGDPFSFLNNNNNSPIGKTRNTQSKPAAV